MPSPLLLLCAVIGYLLGSISTGILYSNYLGRDVRTVGSKNSGASNMLRIYGTRPGVLTFVGDCLKAILSVTAGWLICGRLGAMTAGFFAIIGHNWPVFFGFQGGKGVACSTAVFVLTFPQYGIPAVLLCIAVILLFKYISLGSIIMNICFAALLCIFEPFWPYGLWALVLAVMSLYRHRGNIMRLLNGTERKIGQKEKK